MPVRYIHKTKSSTCYICGQTELKDNPFQNAHLIGFRLGITQLGLTPDFLDSDENIVTTHRKCNKLAELSLKESIQLILDKGYKFPKYIQLTGILG